MGNNDKYAGSLSKPSTALVLQKYSINRSLWVQKKDVDTVEIYRFNNKAFMLQFILDVVRLECGLKKKSSTELFNSWALEKKNRTEVIKKEKVLHSVNMRHFSMWSKRLTCLYHFYFDSTCAIAFICFVLVTKENTSCCHVKRKCVRFQTNVHHMLSGNFYLFCSLKLFSIEIDFQMSLRYDCGHIHIENINFPK